MVAAVWVAEETMGAETMVAAVWVAEETAEEATAAVAREEAATAGDERPEYARVASTENRCRALGKTGQRRGRGGTCPYPCCQSRRGA